MGKTSVEKNRLGVAAQNDPWTFAKTAAVDFGGASKSKQQADMFGGGGKQQTDMFATGSKNGGGKPDPWGPMFKNKQNFAEMHFC